MFCFLLYFMNKKTVKFIVDSVWESNKKCKLNVTLLLSAVYMSEKNKKKLVKLE